MDYAKVSSEIVSKISSVSLTGGSNSAELLGLELVEGRGNFALAVGSPKGMPDVVVKVCSDEPYRYFINAVYNGELSSPMYPVVHSLAEVEDKLVVVMERLIPPEGDAEDQETDLETFLESDDFQPLSEWIDRSPYEEDMHIGNVMIRPATGELVVIDPIW